MPPLAYLQSRNQYAPIAVALNIEQEQPQVKVTTLRGANWTRPSERRSYAAGYG